MTDINTPIPATAERVSVNQTARIIGRTPRTIFRWIDAGYIHAYKVGGQWEIPMQEIERIRSGN